VKTLIITTLVLLIDSSHGRDTLHLGVLVSQDGEIDLSGFLPALDLAIETINNDTSLRYRFDVTINDSMVSDMWAISNEDCRVYFCQCTAASSLRSFIDQIFSQNLIMLIGPDCSIATEPVAEIAPNWNLVQVSHVLTMIPRIKI